jgi:hypothetical protein
MLLLRIQHVAASERLQLHQIHDHAVHVHIPVNNSMLDPVCGLLVWLYGAKWSLSQQ